MPRSCAFLAARIPPLGGSIAGGRRAPGREGDRTNDDLQARRVCLGANPTLNSSLPTLEEMLAAWARDPDKFSEIERRVSQYLPAVLDQADREEPQTARC